MRNPSIYRSIFPDVPRESPQVTKDGEFTAGWNLYFGDLSQALQNNYKNEGILLPPLIQDNMDEIQDLYTDYIGDTYNNLTAVLPDISGQTVYNSNTFITNQFVIATDNSDPAIVILAQWVPMSMMLTYAGDPNGNLAGLVSWFCLDISMMQLYICTQSGDDTTTVWAAV